ncbi:MAG: T9SS type A sorting domain-containing protein [Gemmatimonadota bacterium]|nr:MAG: T9SS type A sorting domain-containing protein [Gemmatimonadota bacterium]
MKICAKVTFLLLLLPGIVYTQGTVERTSFMSTILGSSRTFEIYLPEGYDPDEPLRYPVVYFLHGSGFATYPEIYTALDILIGDGAVNPMILVQPDGLVGSYASYHTNSELWGDFEDFTTGELIEYVNSLYKTIPSPARQCIMAHSWGGYSCMKVALKHPDLYLAVASHGGTPDLNVGVSVWRPHVLAEHGNSPPYEYDPNAGVFSISLYGWATAFSPNLDNPPLNVDFPLDANGAIVDSVLSIWRPHNPTHLASQLPPDNNLTIYFECGTNDEFECYSMNAAFAESLDALGIPHDFRSYPGDHFGQLEERFQISLAFLDSLMKVRPAIYIQPDFIGEPFTGHAPLTVQFTDLSFANPPVTARAWDFDNNGIIDSEEPSPIWIYEQPGIYTVRIEVSSDSLSSERIDEDYIQVFDGESALLFTGNSSCATCPAAPHLNLTEAITIEAWIHPTGWGTFETFGLGRIFDKQNISLYLVDSYLSYNSHSLVFHLIHENGTVSYTNTPEGSIVLNEWQHIAVTYNGENIVNIYINGIEQPVWHAIPPSGNIQENDDEDVILGNSSDHSWTFDGRIDEVRIWNVTRTAEKIRENMDVSLCDNEPDLVGYWQMNEGNGETILDKSGHDHTGVLFDVLWRDGAPLSQSSADSDEDGISDCIDNCLNQFNPMQEDNDEDGVGDVCDNCPEMRNPEQADADNDGTGDVCDSCTDIDDDGYGNPGYTANTCDEDNCPGVYNPDQLPFDQGDLDCNSGIDVLDVLAVINHILASAPLHGKVLDRADCNGDGGVDILDALGIINVILGTGECIPTALRPSLTPEVLQFCESLRSYLPHEDFSRFMILVKAECHTPSEYYLYQNYPNPFNPETQIAFDLPQASRATITIYNLLGQIVDVLFDGEANAGRHAVMWNASEISSGIYLYQLKTRDLTITKKMALIK